MPYKGAKNDISLAEMKDLTQPNSENWKEIVFSYLCVLCNPCYSRWCYIMAKFGHCTTVWESIQEKKKTLSTIFYSLCERGCVNLIVSTNLA